MSREVAMKPAAEHTEPLTDDFGEWVAARSVALQRFAYLVAGNSADAPDLVQDALARALPRWHALAEAGTAEAYVKRSIVNGSISGWRKRRRLVLVDPASAAVEREATGGPEEAADAAAAWELVKGLPPTQRAAVVLRFYEDLSYAQIALVLDCAEATARSHVHRALARLRDRLVQQEVER